MCFVALRQNVCSVIQPCVHAKMNIRFGLSVPLLVIGTIFIVQLHKVSSASIGRNSSLVNKSSNVAVNGSATGQILGINDWQDPNDHIDNDPFNKPFFDHQESGFPVWAVVLFVVFALAPFIICGIVALCCCCAAGGVASSNQRRRDFTQVNSSSAYSRQGPQGYGAQSPGYAAGQGYTQAPYPAGGGYSSGYNPGMAPPPPGWR